MTKQNNHLKSYFGYCFYRGAMQFRSCLDKALTEHGLATPQFGILRLLSINPDLTQNELVALLAIDKASMVKFVVKLEKMKLVKRTVGQTDRRTKHLIITAKGQKKLNICTKIREQIEKDFLRPLTDEEQKMIRQILPKLVRLE